MGDKQQSFLITNKCFFLLAWITANIQRLKNHIKEHLTNRVKSNTRKTMLLKGSSLLFLTLISGSIMAKVQHTQSLQYQETFYCTSATDMAVVVVVVVAAVKGKFEMNTYFAKNYCINNRVTAVLFSRHKVQPLPQNSILLHCD